MHGVILTFFQLDGQLMAGGRVILSVPVPLADGYDPSWWSGGLHCWSKHSPEPVHTFHCLDVLE